MRLRGTDSCRGYYASITSQSKVFPLIAEACKRKCHARGLKNGVVEAPQAHAICSQNINNNVSESRISCDQKSTEKLYLLLKLVKIVQPNHTTLNLSQSGQASQANSFTILLTNQMQSNLLLLTSRNIKWP